MSVLDGVLAEVGQLVQSTGALGLVGVMTAEAALPLPSALVLPVVGARVASGDLSLVAALLATTAGSVLGATLVYALARWGSRAWLARITRWAGIPAARWARIEDRFARHGAPMVLLARLVPGLRCAVPLVAGSLRLPLGRFVAAAAGGSALWNAAWIGGGAWLSTYGDGVVAAVVGTLSAARPVVLGVAVAGAVLAVVRRISGRVVLPGATGR